MKEFIIVDPGKIPDKVSELVIETFEKSESEIKDGIDICLFGLDLKSRMLKWSGANSPLCLVEDNSLAEKEITELKADKQPIGKYTAEQPFVTHAIQLEKRPHLFIHGRLCRSVRWTQWKKIQVQTAKGTSARCFRSSDASAKAKTQSSAF